jgi:hypothetical protein
LGLLHIFVIVPSVDRGIMMGLLIPPETQCNNKVKLITTKSLSKTIYNEVFASREEYISKLFQNTPINQKRGVHSIYHNTQKPLQKVPTSIQASCVFLATPFCTRLLCRILL